MVNLQDFIRPKPDHMKNETAQTRILKQTTGALIHRWDTGDITTDTYQTAKQAYIHSVTIFLDNTRPEHSHMLVGKLKEAIECLEGRIES